MPPPSSRDNHDSSGRREHGIYIHCRLDIIRTDYTFDSTRNLMFSPWWCKSQFYIQLGTCLGDGVEDRLSSSLSSSDGADWPLSDILHPLLEKLITLLVKVSGNP